MSIMTSSFFQCRVGSGCPLGGPHSSSAVSPAATRVSLGSALKSSLSTADKQLLLATDLRVLAQTFSHALLRRNHMKVTSVMVRDIEIQTKSMDTQPRLGLRFRPSHSLHSLRHHKPLWPLCVVLHTDRNSLHKGIQFCQNSVTSFEFRRPQNGYFHYKISNPFFNH